MSGRVYEPDFEPTRRYYRESSSGGSKGSGFDLDKVGGMTVPTNRGSSSNQNTSSSTPKQDDHRRKEPARGPDKNPNAKGLGSRAVDEGLKQVAKKGSGTIVGEGANIASAAKRARDEGAGAGAQAAEATAAGIRAGASVTGVGGAVVKGYDAVKKALGIVGIKIKDRYVVYILLFGVFLSVLPVIIFFLVIFFAWDNPRAIVGLAWRAFRSSVGRAISTTIDQGGASKLAYEVDIHGGQTALAATTGISRPEPGTYEYKLAQIDWEKAKYQTLPVENKCVVKTKEVQSTIDGSKRSVIDSVQLSNNPGNELEGIARANCIDKTYPIFYTIMRSQFIRDGVNRSLNIRYAYAEPVDSPNLKKSPEEIQKVLREKSLTRIWSRGSAYVTGRQATPEAVQAADRAVEEFFFDRDSGTATRVVNKYTDTKYPQSVLDCANNYIPPNEGDTLRNFYQKNIDKMKNDLACGIEPKDLKLYTTLPDESTATNPELSLSLRPKRAALGTVCSLYENLLDPSDEAVKNYQERVKARINSAAVAAWQSATYADTNRARFLNIQELSKDFYKIAGMQEGQEYNYALDGRKVGIALEPDAISRIVGYYNKRGADNPITQAEQPFIEGLNSVFDYVNDRDLCTLQKDLSLNQSQINKVNAFWNDAYPKFKRAIAGLDFYSRPEKSTSISQIYKNLTYEDIFFRIIRLESNTATSGTEDGPQNFNRMNFGMKAYMNGVSLAMGGRFLTQNEAIAQDMNNKISEEYDLQTRGIAYRLFDVKNPGSITSRLRVAFTDRPHKIAGNVASILNGVLSPLRNVAGEKGTLTAMVTGRSRVAMAASVYDAQNLKLDPAGIPESVTTIDAIENARIIENLKKSNNPSIIEKFTNWDRCFNEFIPSRFHLLYPSAEKKELYEKYCQPLFDSSSDKRKDPNSLESRYAAYHFYNLQADALLYLSKPDTEDRSLDAISSLSVPGTPTTPTTTSGGTAPPGGVGDTSAQSCPAGTIDAGIGTKKDRNGTPLYNIRLCTAGGITVNVTIASNLLNLLNAAKASGITLGGSGYRSFERQKELYAQNCGGGRCSPPTAVPGTSNHESGEAVDFTQNGSILTRSSSGYAWLKANAQTYFFYNLPSEPWHWSKDGK